MTRLRINTLALGAAALWGAHSRYPISMNESSTNIKTMCPSCAQYKSLLKGNTRESKCL